MMRLQSAVLVLLTLNLACDKSAPPPPNGRQAVKGLPPLQPGAPAAPPSAPIPTAPGDRLEGTIEVSAALAEQIKRGDILFLSAKAIDESGAVQRMPLAVERIEIGTLPMPFRLSSENVMMPGTPFVGAVVITARIDRDGEAKTRAPGDIEGVLKARIPARDLKIVLDTPVQP